MRQLRAKFGELPEPVEAQVREASEDEIGRRAVRILTAETLEAVLR
jgi:hypothetical protein